MTEVKKAVEVKKSKTIQFYVRDAKGFPVAFVALESGDEDGAMVTDNDGEGWYAVGISVHNPSDRFNRNMARQIAIGRAKSLVSKPNRERERGPVMAIWGEFEEIPTVATVSTYIRRWAEEGMLNLPTRVVKALVNRGY